ncbi:MAG: universal stress protein [Solirubrobacteraceae bacterium]
MGADHRDLRWTIVAGYEGSASSDDALVLAQDLFDVVGARLVAGCVYRYRALGGRFGSGDRAAAVAESGCRRTRRRGAEPMVVPATSPAEGLGYLVAAADADLVVVGSARRALRGRLLRGSTADGVLRRGFCSVAIAPSGYRARPRQLRTVGVVFDGTPSSRNAVRIASAIAVAAGGVVRVYTTRGALPDDGAREVLAPLLGGAPLEALASVRTVVAESGAVVDLVVAGPSGRLLIPGLTPRRHRRRLRACRCPVLILGTRAIEVRGRSQTAAREAAVS